MDHSESISAGTGTTEGGSGSPSPENFQKLDVK